MNKHVTNKYTCNRVKRSAYSNGTKVKRTLEHAYEKIRAGNPKKTYKVDDKNLFQSKKTTYNKRLASKIEVADWELKVVVTGTEPIWVAFDW